MEEIEQFKNNIKQIDEQIEFHTDKLTETSHKMLQITNKIDELKKQKATLQKLIETLVTPY
jgi:hypothetical protein